MKKIDLHVHTISTPSDRQFAFDLKRLKDYVNVRSLDGIAITNHNTFNLNQFEDVRNALDITVLPGIEIDLEGVQILRLTA
jgi:predicted metal-dependent phosphoesterase TrpH